MEHSPVCVICVLCKNNIDGIFKLPDKLNIYSLQTNKAIGIVGEYNKKKGYLHVKCANGIEAEKELNKV
jgi:hypothetical protein